jgi:hypothetical protein
MKYAITITDEQYSLLLKSVGHYKTWLNDGGFYRSAHSASNLLAQLKNNSQVIVDEPVK